MADFPRCSCSVTPQSYLQQILDHAPNRWLLPFEICELLLNYEKFHLATEPPNTPLSGSLFLFDRRVVRYFRRDNHNWRKRKGRNSESHEILKEGTLQCYYARGEDNESFQRRTYWLLDPEYSHIVLVQYLEVKVSEAQSSNSMQTSEHGDKMYIVLD